ncbi:MAG: hypothetical protein BMS9Abin29_0474 [Gemmatimonadota bacterium]|nr:MAG: hypothetical protein BMS9Abin29_0474 [Gemmatimonadota bacterium]
MAMTCSTARETLWPPEKLRLAGEGVLLARKHVDDCADCREYFRQDRRLLDAYHRLREERAPRRVRERVFDSLARERAGSLARELNQDARTGPGSLSLPRWMVAAAASLVLLSALGTTAMWVNRLSAGAEAGELFVDDYLRRAVGQDNILTSDPDQISRFLVKELGFLITPMQVEGLRLAGAEVCFLDGRRGAMIRYQQNGREVTHYLIPREGVEERAPRQSGILPGGFEGRAAPSVITWATPSIEHALVGEVPAERLMRIARKASSL